ncbi:hypothetical protein QAD02_011170 [Eretmocerus hayati]|uniref:Uncharacterized protein n=1 Tax=Eretmocerus hayati TaxID=131215 RepID=A0ACC2NVU0_9HYME|nr:hypothetical protein QAD02_011170 [Eretmocerus hayati]
MEESGYSWPVAFNNFSDLPHKIGESVYSAPFKIGQYEFELQLYPGGETRNSKGYVSVFLTMCETSKAIETKYTMSILVGKERCFRAEPACRKFSPGLSYGWDRLVRRSTLDADVLQVTGDQLVILVELFNSNLSILPDTFHQKLRSYGEYVNNKQHSDVKVIVRGQTIFAHKVILTCGNAVFTAMFMHNLKENNENIINIEDIEFDVMLELLRFMYTGHISNVEKMPEELLIAADKYGVEELKNYCENYLCELLSVKNVLDYLNFASKYNLRQLKTQAVDFLIMHRKDVVHTPEFESNVRMMSPDVVIDVLKTLLLL